MLHEFSASLSASERKEDREFWLGVYRSAFHDFAHMQTMPRNGWAQRAGIDRVINLKSGKVLLVDEKVRSNDYCDVALEYWSVWKNGNGHELGWVEKDLACDYIAYAFAPTRRCILLPFQELRRAWIRYGEKWKEAGRHKRDGFSLVDASNLGYVSKSVCVPEGVLCTAIRDALLIPKIVIQQEIA